MPRESADVHLINDGPGGRVAQRAIAIPVVVSRIDHDTLHRRRRVVARKPGGVAGVACRNCYAAPIWVQQNLAGIKIKAARGIPGSVYAISVELARPEPRHEHVPIVIRSILYGIDGNDTSGLGVIIPIEEQQVDRRGTSRIYAKVDTSGKVDSIGNDARSERRASPRDGIRESGGGGRHKFTLGRGVPLRLQSRAPARTRISSGVPSA